MRLNAAAAAAAAATGAGAAAAASDGFAFRAPAPAVGVSQPAPLAGSSSSSAAGSAQPYLYAPSSGALSNGGDQPSRSASDASGAAFRPPWQSPGKARPDGFGAPSAASTGSRPRPESPLPGALALGSCLAWLAIGVHMMKRVDGAVACMGRR